MYALDQGLNYQCTAIENEEQQSECLFFEMLEQVPNLQDLKVLNLPSPPTDNRQVRILQMRWS